MNSHADKTQENRNQAIASNLSMPQSKKAAAFQFKDTRKVAVVQRKLNDLINNSPKIQRLKAIQKMAKQPVQKKAVAKNAAIIQRTTYADMDSLLETEFADQPWLTIDDATTYANFTEAEEQLPFADFLNIPGSDPFVDPNVVRPDGRNTIKFDRTNPKGWDPDFYIATIIHELIHIANLRKYQKNAPRGDRDLDFANMHLPAAVGVPGKMGLTPNQWESFSAQIKTLLQNWTDLIKVSEADQNKGLFGEAAGEHLRERITYGGGKAMVENDTVLFDLAFYLEKKKLTGTDTFKLVKRMLKEATDRRSKPGTQVRRVDAEAHWLQFWKW